MKRTAANVLLQTREGQALLEFLFASLLAMVFILGVLQIGMLFNAHSMVKLAAFNAARAAIVARDTSQPEEPVTLDEMRKKARLAAFLTLIPVIPEGFVPTNLSSFMQILSQGGIVAAGRTALEYTCCQDAVPLFDAPRNAGERNFVDVKFVPATSTDPLNDSEISLGGPIEFDNPGQSANNLIKVVVTWQYPLVIPIANRIIIAAVRPVVYLAALVAATSNPILAAQIVGIRNDVEKMPVWALGTSLDQVFALDNVMRLTWRVPVRSSYVMRMQWDRKPS